MGYTREDKAYDTGSIPVWISVERNRYAGGSLEELPPNLPVTIPPAVPAQLDEMGGAVKLMQVFELAVDISTGSTSVSFKTPPDWQPVTAGDVLMKAPATLTATGTAYTVGTPVIDASTGLTSFDITATSWGTATAGDLFVESKTTAGASRSIKVVPNGLTYSDMRLVEGTYQQTTPVIVSGEFLVDRVAPIPAAVLAVLPMITPVKE